MSGFRAFFDFGDGETPVADTLTLSEGESRHLCGALRAARLDKVDAFDLSGKVAHCEIAEASAKRAVLRVLSVDNTRADSSRPKIYLAQCLPKGKVFDEIIRQCLEAGASGLIPIVSSRTISRPDPADAERKLEKWRLHVIEAKKQSGNLDMFDIRAPMDFNAFIAKTAPSFDLKIVASLKSGAIPILSAAKAEQNAVNNVCILIGPEGDMTDAEYKEAFDAGFAGVTLGRNVMKCDTAAISAIAALSAYFDATA